MKKKRIMIVEDEELIAYILKINLNKIGFDVCQAVSTGAEAIEIFKTAKPDIVLMDVILKGPIDGIEAAEKIQEIDEIPVIFTTGFLDEETKQRAKDVKSAEYFIKPVKTVDLITAIENALKNSKAI